MTHHIGQSNISAAFVAALMFAAIPTIPEILNHFCVVRYQ
jgi:hypothetical protein